MDQCRLTTFTDNPINLLGHDGHRAAFKPYINMSNDISDVYVKLLN